MIVYLANAYGFSKQQRKELLPKLVARIESLGHTVWEPFERNEKKVSFKDSQWPYYIGQLDKADIKKCDAIFAVVNGTPPDEGAMVELGMAIAWQKKIYLFRDDVRLCTDNDKYPLNLMIFCGLPQYDWKKYYFTSINEIYF